jgi:hypothetical protein
MTLSYLCPANAADIHQVVAQSQSLKRTFLCILGHVWQGRVKILHAGGEHLQL